MRYFLYELLMLGKEAAPTSLKVCEAALEKFQLDAPDADDALEQWLCEMMTVWRGFQALLRPDIMDLNFDNDLSSIKNKSMKDKTVLGIGKEVLVSCDYYKGLLKDWEVAAPHLKVRAKQQYRFPPSSHFLFALLLPSTFSLARCAGRWWRSTCRTSHGNRPRPPSSASIGARPPSTTCSLARRSCVQAHATASEHSWNRPSAM